MPGRVAHRDFDAERRHAGEPYVRPEDAPEADVRAAARRLQARCHEIRATVGVRRGRIVARDTPGAISWAAWRTIDRRRVATAQHVPTGRHTTRAGRPRARRAGARARSRSPGRQPADPDEAAAATAAVAATPARPATRARPTETDVLRAIRPGHVAGLRIPAGFLVDDEARLAASVVQHLACAREHLGGDAAFPLVGSTFRAVAAKLGHDLSIKRAYRMRRRLVAAGVITEAGSYRQRYLRGPAFAGYRVTLYRTVRLLRTAPPAARRAPGTLEASVSHRQRVNRPVRRLAWFETVLGSLDRRPPPGMTASVARRMSTLDDLRAPGSATA